MTGPNVLNFEHYSHFSESIPFVGLDNKNGLELSSLLITDLTVSLYSFI